MWFLGSAYRFDGQAISSLGNTAGNLIPLSSPAGTKLSRPSILKKRNKKVNPVLPFNQAWIHGSRVFPSLQKSRRLSESSGCSSGILSDFSLNSPGMSGNILLSPTTLVKGTDNPSAIPGYPLGLSPAKSPIKGLHFSPSLFLNSPGALENSKLTSTPVLRRVQQKQHGLKTPPG